MSPKIVVLSTSRSRSQSCNARTTDCVTSSLPVEVPSSRPRSSTTDCARSSPPAGTPRSRQPGLSPSTRATEPPSNNPSTKSQRKNMIDSGVSARSTGGPSSSWAAATAAAAPTRTRRGCRPSASSWRTSAGRCRRRWKSRRCPWPWAGPTPRAWRTPWSRSGGSSRAASGRSRSTSTRSSSCASRWPPRPRRPPDPARSCRHFAPCTTTWRAS
mmetsp:Transcript_118923/g.337177  ORF Transcript_118923/g.337177 Transcript_118923/m.337177 type:complete len:214 (+) Transcript_118923:981-1622(+)